MGNRRIIASLFVALTLALPLRARAQTTATDSLRSSQAGVYSAGQAERGKMTYAISCRACHTAASHTGVTFSKWWKGRTLADLYGYMSTQMPKNDPGSLNADQYADVVAYLLKMNAMPAGSAELLPDSAALAQIRIELPGPPVKSSKKATPKRPATPSPTRTKRP
jgi:S-disulfanyl-L-cysteine oxidoreductase SoxD